MGVMKKKLLSSAFFYFRQNTHNDFFKTGFMEKRVGSFDISREASDDIEFTPTKSMDEAFNDLIATMHRLNNAKGFTVEEARGFQVLLENLTKNLETNQKTPVFPNFNSLIFWYFCYFSINFHIKMKSLVKCKVFILQNW